VYRLGSVIVGEAGVKARCPILAINAAVRADSHDLGAWRALTPLIIEGSSIVLKRLSRISPHR
jgi:hypothetical protein